MEKNYKLPKYWCLEINSDNKDLVRNWRKIFGFPEKTLDYKYIYQDGTIGNMGENSYNIPKLITTYEFRRYVLNEPQEPINEPIKEDFSRLKELLNNIK